MAVVIIQRTLVRAIALRIESKEKTTFMTTIMVMMLETELWDDDALTEKFLKLTICQISFMAVKMMKTPPIKTIML